MPLPMIDVVKYHLQVPSTKEEIEFRPFLVREEKILLMALNAGQSSAHIGGALSSVEIISTLYGTIFKLNDKDPLDI